MANNGAQNSISDKPGKTKKKKKKEKDDVPKSPGYPKTFFWRLSKFPVSEPQITLARFHISPIQPPVIPARYNRLSLVASC